MTTRTPGATRRRLAAGAVALLVGAVGCGGDVESEVTQVVPVENMRAQVRDRAGEVVAGLGLRLPEATRIGPAPCTGALRDLAEDGRYTVTGNWQVPLPADRQRDTFQQLRERLQRDGYQVVQYRELPDGVRATLVARDPASGFEISLGSTEPPEAVALAVTSPCVVTPDGRYPG